MDLPPVKQEKLAEPKGGAPEQQAVVERLGTERNPELSGQSQAGSIPAPVTDDDQTTTSTGAPAPSLSADDSSTMIADDVDLIEKEWVEKAKHIVAQTKDDPHKQNKEISKVKSDYIKKRYNKDTRADEK